MSEEEARALLRTLNTTESWPLGYEADGFSVDGWEFDYQGSGRWYLRFYQQGHQVIVHD